MQVGGFTIAGDVICSPATSQVYIVATGGNPGLSANSTNSDIALMAALGQCGSLSSSTHIKLNELTTIGSIVPVSGFMKVLLHS